MNAIPVVVFRAGHSPDADQATALLFWRRLIFTAVLEARKCRNGLPTPLAILQRHWIEHSFDTRHPLYTLSFDDACRCIGREPGPARKRALLRIKRAWRLAAWKHWMRCYEETREATYLVSGLEQVAHRQAVLGLIDADQYAEVAGED